MKKKTIKLGEIRGTRFYPAEGAELPRHMTHKIIDKRLVYMSDYQARHAVSQRHERVRAGA